MKFGVTTTNRSLSDIEWSFEWHHSHYPPTKKFRSQRSVGKVICTVLWDAQGIILLNFVEPGVIVNSERYIKPIKLKSRIARIGSESKITFFLQQDNARAHVSLKTTECETKFSWTVLPHLPYSPDLAPSDFYLFGSLKNGLRGQSFVDNNAVIDAVKNWLPQLEESFISVVYRPLFIVEKKYIQSGGDYEEK